MVDNNRSRAACCCNSNQIYTHTFGWALYTQHKPLRLNALHFDSQHRKRSQFRISSFYIVYTQWFFFVFVAKMEYDMPFTPKHWILFLHCFRMVFLFLIFHQFNVEFEAYSLTNECILLFLMRNKKNELFLVNLSLWKKKTSAVIFLFVSKYICHLGWLSFSNRKIESAKIHNELLLNHQKFWSV